MNSVINFTCKSIETNCVRFFTVEIITFNGDSFIEEIEAPSAEAAQEIASNLYLDVDYTMVQSSFEMA